MRRLLTVMLLLVLIAPVLPTASRAAAQGTCGAAPPPRLTVGQSARVVVSDGTGNNMRATANTGATVLGVLADGEVFSVLGGPQCSENYWWWQVRRWDGQTGWTTEGVTGDYWIEPWPILDAKLSPGTRPNLPGVSIAFLSGYEGYLVPTTMKVSGEDLQTIGTAPSYDNRLVWSPDGSRLIFSDGKDLWSAGQFDIVNLTNSTGSANYEATVSPDGMWVAFTTNRDGNTEIYVVDTNGFNPRNLTNNPTSDSAPAWSPDGTRIAFVSDRDGNPEIYTMSAADGSGAARLTSNTFADTNPVWARDGKLAYVSAQGDFSDLWIIDTTGPRALTTDEKINSPVWSPDSTRIAYVAESPVNSGREEVFSIRADGTDRIQYTVNGSKVRGITWSPGGVWLAYADDSSGNFDLYAIRASGIGVVRLTNNPGLDAFPVFQPPTMPNLPDEAASATATETSGVPVPGSNPAAQDLQLIYTTSPAVFTLQNTSGQEINLDPVSFSGGGLVVPTSIWKDYTASPLNAFKPIGCLMIWPFGVADQPAPPECGDARQGWITNSGYIFWTQDTFTVNYSGVPVATCQTAAGRCTVDLP
jgi:Tol biopolymer transport system component